MIGFFALTISGGDPLQDRDTRLRARSSDPLSAWHEVCGHESGGTRHVSGGWRGDDEDEGEEQEGCRGRADEGEESRFERKTLLGKRTKREGIFIYKAKIPDLEVISEGGIKTN